METACTKILEILYRYKQPEFCNILKYIGTYLELIVGGYTCVLEPCDVGIIKPLKAGIREQCNQWACECLFGIFSTHLVPAPDRKKGI